MSTREVLYTDADKYLGKIWIIEAGLGRREIQTNDFGFVPSVEQLDRLIAALQKAREELVK